jgi:hypothetical protein
MSVNISANYLNKVSDMGKHDGASDREWNSVFRANGLSTAMKWNQELSNLDKHMKPDVVPERFVVIC